MTDFAGESDLAGRVYSALSRVAKGKLTTYKRLARAAGSPRAFRAVGNILHKNPYAPAVPCHRVIKSDGQVGGYAGEVSKKIKLLSGEGIKIKNGRIVDLGRYLTDI